jgi:carbon catabolite-derepressing protein kinase
MLVVDPVKRITVTEIRALPWFQQNLPHYLQPLPPTPSIERVPALPVDDLSTLLLISENEADPEKVAQAKGLVWSEDLGILDPSTVNELCEKITSYSETDVWEALQKPGDNQIKVAYQLVRDHKRVLKDCECHLGRSPAARADTRRQRPIHTMRKMRRRWNPSWLPRHPLGMLEWKGWVALASVTECD